MSSAGLHPWISGGVVFLGALLLVALVYLAVHLGLRRQIRSGDESITNSVIGHVVTIHALILALVFAQEQVNVFDLRRTATEEAAAAADVFYDLDRYDAVANVPLRRALAEYVSVVIHEEWETLAHGELSQRAWILWDTVYRGILDLEPSNARQESLRSRMLDDIETISRSRDIRGADSASGVTGLFWMVVVFGVLIVVFLEFVVRGKRPNLLLLAAFLAYNAVIIYTILAMANPYSPPGAIGPAAFLEIFRHDMADMLAVLQ